MNLQVKHQDTYSRGELLLRSFFGLIYILLPHAFVLAFMGIWSAIIGFIAFWSILFTGRYPQSFFEFQVGLERWNLRLNARIYNLADGYPAFGISAKEEQTTFEMPYPESLSRGLVIVKALFGVFYVALPHLFILAFRSFATQILVFLAWWAVLFTGKYPKSWHEFNVGTLRWATRINLYLRFMTDTYPPFTGKVMPGENTAPAENKPQ